MLTLILAVFRRQKPRERVSRVCCHCAHDQHCPRCHGVGFTLRARSL